MTFQKGNKVGLRGGRKKGQRNKDTRLIRFRYEQLMEHYSIDQMKADLMQLEPHERLRIMTGLLDFFMPKLNRTDHTMSKDNETITIMLPGEESPLPPLGKGEQDPSTSLRVMDEQIEEEDEDRFFEPEDIQPDLFTDVEGSA